MRRWKIIFSSCLVLLLTTLSLAWAAQEYKTQVKLSGTKLSVQHLVQGKDKIKESAVLLNKNNKIVARWKPRTTNKWYKDYQDGWKYFRYIPYTMDMQKLPAGTYRFVTTTITVKLIVADDSSKFSTQIPILEDSADREYLGRSANQIEAEIPIQYGREQGLLALIYSGNTLRTGSIQEYEAGIASPLNDYVYFFSVQFCKA